MNMSRTNTRNREVIHLTRGRLEELAKSEDPNIRQPAKKLQNTIRNNPCQLLLDEKQLCEDLGIQMVEKIKNIQLHPTGRVSVIHEIQTQDIEATELWAKIAMPSSNPKRKKVQDRFATQTS